MSCTHTYKEIAKNRILLINGFETQTHTKTLFHQYLDDALVDSFSLIFCVIPSIKTLRNPHNYYKIQKTSFVIPFVNNSGRPFRLVRPGYAKIMDRKMLFHPKKRKKSQSNL